MKEKIEIIPYGDMVILKPDEVEHTTEAGLVLPDQGKEEATTGVVISVGPGRDGVPMQSEPGDHLLYTKYAGTEFVLHGTTYRAIREINVFCKLPKPNK